MQLRHSALFCGFFALSLVVPVHAKVHHFALPNGVEVFISPQRDCSSVQLGVWFRVGMEHQQTAVTTPALDRALAAAAEQVDRETRSSTGQPFLVLVGAIRPERAIALVQKYFGHLSARSARPVDPSPFDPTTILPVGSIGYLLPEAKHTDHAAISVAVQILDSKMEITRLPNASAAWTLGPSEPTEVSFPRAKALALELLARKVADPVGTARAIGEGVILNDDPSYFQHLSKRIVLVSEADVRRVLRTYFRPEQQISRPVQPFPENPTP